MPFAHSGYWDRSISSWIPEGDQQAFKTAFYNAVVLAFLACCLAVIVAVFFLLQAVLKSMLWAMLCGTVLFPFKKRLTEAIEWYLLALKDSGTPLFIGIVVAPLAALDRGAEALWSAVVSKAALAFLGIYVVAAAVAYESNLAVILDAATKLYSFLDNIIWLYSSKWVQILAFIYACFFFGYVYLIGAEANKFAVRALSIPLWFVALCTTAQYFGPLRVFVAVSSAVVILLIVLRAIDTGNDDVVEDSEPKTTTTDVQAPEMPKDLDSTTKDVGIEEQPVTGESFGNRCIRAIVGACSLLWITRHPSALVLLVLLFIYGILKRTGEYFDLQQHAASVGIRAVEAIQAKFGHVLEVSLPSSLRKFFKLLFYGDRRIVDGLRSSAGILSTIFVMIALLVTTVLFGGFLIFQLQAETMHLISITSSVINRNFSANEHLSSWVIKAMNANDIDSSDLDSVMENAYEYGRVWLPTQARMLVNRLDKERADMMEAQVRQIIDKLYESWLERQTGNAGKAVAKAGSSLNQLWDHVQGSMDLRSLGMDLVGFVKENVGMLLSVLETLWGILSANVTFLFSISAALLGLVLSFGMELLNFLIGIIVFLTVLYYLLSFSRSEWKPIEWLMMFTPGGTGSAGNAFSKSVETAISNVFVLSFKMALFYGLYMWFIHNVFALNVTFLPSILAAVLAAVPFLAPYWVCIPGAIELGLVRGETFSAVLFFIFGFAPTMLVDTAFYKEVKGSHPYLTGLSVVGGIYWLGLEGAFIGPILLCCMLVLMDMYRNILESQQEFRIT